MPSGEKWVDWWQKEREIKALEDIPRTTDTGTPEARKPKQTASPLGCGAVIALAFVIGGCTLLLQKGGCISSEQFLRVSTSIATTQIETNAQKRLVFVHFTVNNGSRWPTSLNIRVEISKTASPEVLLQNSVRLLGVPPRQSKVERVGFDLPRLDELGIPNLGDADLCRLTYSIEWITTAGSEPH